MLTVEHRRESRSKDRGQHWNTSLRHCEFLLTPAQISRSRTLSDGQFNWGGCLQNRNGGVQRLANPEWKPGHSSANA